MDEKAEGGRSKAQFVADVLNRTLYTLVINCTKADGVRGYFDVGVLAYSGSDVMTGFGGRLGSDVIHSIKDIGEAPVRVEERMRKVDDGAGDFPEDVADALRLIHTNDGDTLLFNLHVTAAGGQEIVFPTAEGALLDEYARMLFRMSSPLPARLAKLAGDIGHSISEG
jgi:hypothetical protein